MLHARLQRDCSDMAKSGEMSLADFEIAMPFDRAGVASRLAALLSRTGQAEVDTDVVFTLYAAEGDAQPTYIGQVRTAHVQHMHSACTTVRTARMCSVHAAHVQCMHIACAAHVQRICHGYTGQAYVNLHECLRAAKDHLGSEEPPLVLETDESRAVGTLMVSVRALAAMRALVSPTPPPPPRAMVAAPKGFEETHHERDTADNEWEWDLDTGG